MSKISEYLTVGEAAEFLGVSKDTLRRWDRSGNLPARRHPVSRYRLYVEQDLDKFLSRLRDGLAPATDGKPRRKNCGA
jgi:excisionase family DNA binding protein